MNEVTIYIGRNEYGVLIVSRNVNEWASGHTVDGPFTNMEDARKRFLELCEEELDNEPEI